MAWVRFWDDHSDVLCILVHFKKFSLGIRNANLINTFFARLIKRFFALQMPFHRIGCWRLITKPTPLSTYAQILAITESVVSWTCLDKHCLQTTFLVGIRSSIRSFKIALLLPVVYFCIDFDLLPLCFLNFLLVFCLFFNFHNCIFCFVLICVYFLSLYFVLTEIS